MLQLNKKFNPNFKFFPNLNLVELTLVVVPKSYITDTSRLFQSYINQIGTRCCLYRTIVPLQHHQNAGRISDILIRGKLENPEYYVHFEL